MEKNIKKPMSNTTIYKVMLIMSLVVGTVFFVKNLIGGAKDDAAFVGISLLVFISLVLILFKLKVAEDKQQFIVCMFIVLLVFIISLNSGDYYSDDFSLYLAVIGLSGLYMRPIYTLIQMVLIDVLLIAAYAIHPEKADPIGQYAMCVVVFSVAAVTFYMAIRRGCAYTVIAEERTNQAEEILSSVRNAGEKLQENCDASRERIHSLKGVNDELEDKTNKLQIGSREITKDTQDVVVTFEDVKDRMQKTEEHIENLNGEVKIVEDSLDQNKENLVNMVKGMQTVRNTFTETSSVFAQLQAQISDIAKVTSQLGSISFNTTILALNATIESARAGEAGKGFEVVASNVQDLAKDSNECTEDVMNIVTSMQKLINQTTEQLSESMTALNSSMDSLEGFRNSFDGLTTNFSNLYSNIERQNSDVHKMDDIVERLKVRIGEMSESSRDNQDAVSDISEAMNIYKENIDKIIKDTRQINDISNGMLAMANKE